MDVSVESRGGVVRARQGRGEEHGRGGEGRGEEVRGCGGLAEAAAAAVTGALRDGLHTLASQTGTSTS